VVLNHPAGIQTFLKKVKDIDAGEEHAAYVDEKGDVFTWGEGSFGQLGHGNKDSHHTPKRVQLDFKVKHVACGGSHTAFVSKDDDSVWMCGRNRDGQVGFIKGRSSTFERVNPEGLSKFHDGSVESIALGANHTLAYVKN
jgi:alpha-tubulin suppressor-like RCC1 family protein